MELYAVSCRSKWKDTAFTITRNCSNKEWMVSIGFRRGNIFCKNVLIVETVFPIQKVC